MFDREFFSVRPALTVAYMVRDPRHRISFYRDGIDARGEVKSYESPNETI